METIALIVAVVALILALIAFLRKPKPVTGVDHSAEIKKLRDQLAALERKVTENTKRIDDLINAVEQLRKLEDRLKELEKKVTENSGRIDELTNRIEQLKTEIESLKRQIETMEIPDMEFIKMTLTEIADNTQKTFLGDGEIPKPWNEHVTETVQIAVKK